MMSSEKSIIFKFAESLAEEGFLLNNFSLKIAQMRHLIGVDFKPDII